MLKPNSTVTNNLIKARELIADEKNWCQGEYSIGERMCAVGAISRVYGVMPGNYPAYMETYDALDCASQELFELHPEYVNDHSEHSAVMRMFDRAIELSLQD